MKLSYSGLITAPSFRVTLLLFAGLNLASWVRFRFFLPCCEQATSFGFPFPVHISGGIDGSANYYMLGLLLDIVIALTVALLVTWIAKLIAN